ncbi:hypothetical protein [Streptomyces lichenis]|uniref:HEAT repeat domain-containing protein n=1 Tax=Streptomyces lichenis TaxID=2306967 RepID=A0ABT0IFT7_9ACTN|nr:hypothetical protein [Streptomyces lichenis]MCK8680196.1 hypothetical protein [Streptomyces lichenis]
MADGTLAAVDEVPWERVVSEVGRSPAGELRRGLRRLVRKGRQATEEDACEPFERMSYGYSMRATGDGAVLATVLLPVLVALAGDPELGCRTSFVDDLVGLHEEVAGARPEDVDAGWREAWERHAPAIGALLVDQDPAVRREALGLAGGIGGLLERWREERDPAVRLTVLLALGTAAAGSADAGAVERVRAVAEEVLRTGVPVMRAAAVHAWAAFEPRVAVEESELLVEVVCDPDARFEDVWYAPGVQGAFAREDVARWSAQLFEDEPRTQLAFALRLLEEARRTGNAPVCREMLDAVWQVLVVLPSAAAVLLPLAGALLADPDDGVRYRAVHLLAVLGAQAAPYAEELAALVDDPGEAWLLEGTIGDHARWALARIGDQRALPGLVERLCAPYRGAWSRGYVMGDPRLPEVEEVLAPLRTYAEALVPEVRAALAEGGGGGPLTGTFLRVLAAWGPAAAPALPEMVALLGDARYAREAVNALLAMGPAARSAEPAVRGCAHLGEPADHPWVAWACWRLGGDREAALRSVGAEMASAEEPYLGPIRLHGVLRPGGGAVRRAGAPGHGGRG